MKKLWSRFLDSLEIKNTEQRKHIVTGLNALAAVIIAQMTFLGHGLQSMLGAVVAVLLWYVGYILLSKY